MLSPLNPQTGRSVSLSLDPSLATRHSTAGVERPIPVTHYLYGALLSDFLGFGSGSHKGVRHGREPKRGGGGVERRLRESETAENKQREKVF